MWAERTLAAGSANQPVSATLSGLAPNVTYDYRLVAVERERRSKNRERDIQDDRPAAGATAPLDRGIPAPGQRLTCKSGVSGSGASSATLSYAWLRTLQGDLRRERFDLRGWRARTSHTTCSAA